MIRKVYGPVDARSVQQLENCLAVEEGSIGALMGDHHPGYSMPIGGVWATREIISPSAVGFDIGCGNLYAETSIDAKDVNVPKVMEEIADVISFGMGQKNSEQIGEHPVYDDIERLGVDGVLSKEEARNLVTKARAQLGTVGSGNHYVDLFENRQNGKLGVGVHFGSRGLGHTIASGFMSIAQGGAFSEKRPEGGMDSAPLVLPLDMPSGQGYERAMNVGLDYAYAGRGWVVDRIVRGILQTRQVLVVHNNHNYAAREAHDGQNFIVHRKGATPAFPVQSGFVGATMGEDALIVTGVNTPEAHYNTLNSTVHGAGRAMSRTEAGGKTKVTKQWKCSNRDCTFAGAPLRDYSRGKDGSLPKCLIDGGKLRQHHNFREVRKGVIDWPLVQQMLRLQGVYLIGAGADEAPGAYKRLDDVIQSHVEDNTIQIVTRLRPLGVIMAGPDIYDPYRD